MDGSMMTIINNILASDCVTILVSSNIAKKK